MTLSIVPVPVPVLVPPLAEKPPPDTITPAQRQVIDFLNLEQGDLDTGHLQASEFAWKKWSPNAQAVYETAKSLCRFHPNIVAILRDCIHETLIALLEPETARKFAGLNSEKRLAFIVAATKTACNRTVRRPLEFQFAILDRDHRVKSSNVNKGGLITGKPGEKVYVVENIPERRADWTLANEYEDALIDRIDRQRAGEKEPEPLSEYEHAQTILSDKDLAFYWDYKVDMELGKQRVRPARSNAEHKRYSRLKARLREEFVRTAAVR